MNIASFHQTNQLNRPAEVSEKAENIQETQEFEEDDAAVDSDQGTRDSNKVNFYLFKFDR